MEVTTVNPNEVSTHKIYANSWCTSPPYELPTEYQYIIQSGYVTSWRGARPKPGCSNNFTLTKYRVNGSFSLIAKAKQNYWIGGPNYLKILWGIQGSVGKALGLNFQDFLDDSLFLQNRDYMISRVMSKVNKELFAGFSELFELSESLHYMHKLFSDLESLVALWRRLKSYKDLAGAWLEYRYAIMPIILSINSLINAKREFHPKISTRYNYERKTSNNYAQVYGGIQSGLYYQSTTEDSIHAGSTVAIKSQWDPNPMGFGGMDFVIGVWEVIPYSFLIDWFIRVQDWLTALRDTNLIIKDKFVTVAHNRTVRLWIDVAKSEVIGSMSIGPTQGAPLYINMSHVVRYANASMVMPIMPPLNPMPLSLLHTIDAMALTIKKIMR